MKLLFLFLISLLGICKANWGNTISNAVLNKGFDASMKKTTACVIIKMQQCIADLLKSAPLLFLSGKQSVDLRTKKEFGDCFAEVASCFMFSNKTERSQKQKDFCGDDEDCYDDDEEDEDSYPTDSFKAFLNCFLKLKKIIFGNIADVVLDAFGYYRGLLFPEMGREYTTPNMIMCDSIKKNFKSMISISRKNCGSGGEMLWPIVLFQMKRQSLLLYEMCSLSSLRSELRCDSKVCYEMYSNL